MTPSKWKDWAVPGASLGVVVGGLLGALEALFTLSGPDGGSRAATGFGGILLAAGWGGFLFGMLGSWLWLVARGLEPVRRRLGADSRLASWLLSAAASLPVVAFFLWVPTGWVTSHFAELDALGKTLAGLTYLGITVGVVLASRLTFAFAARQQRGEPTPAWLDWSLVLAASALAVAAHWADRTVLVGLYEDFHDGLAGLSAVAAALAVALLRVHLSGLRRLFSRLERPRLLSGTLLAIALAIASLEAFAPQAFDAGGTALHDKLVARGRALSDFDGDGSGSLFGGLDCAAFDASRSPRAFDVPKNDVDENCTGQDASWPPPRPKPSRPPPSKQPLNVLLLTIDATRADHLSTYGHSRKTSPNIDALAEGSLRFERAFAQSTKTFYSLPSLHTGRLPTNFTKDYDHPKARKSERYGYYLGADVPTLAESLREVGYSTALVSSLRMLRSLGLARGFQKTRWTADVGKQTAAALRRSKPPFFIWMHALHPHDPYEKQAGHDFGDGVLDRYDSEIAKADAEIGKALRALGDREQDTIVIVTADHGEAFGEHGLTFHPQELYTELLRVPLVVKIPGVAPREVSTVVELVDLYPTLCELLPITKGCDDVDGETLLNAVHGERATRGAYSVAINPERVVLRRSLVDETFRLIHDVARDRIELYDLQADPTEQRDLFHQKRERAHALLEAMDSRPLVRQSELVRDYEASKRPEALTAHFSVLHGRELLDYVLDRVPPEPSELVREHLERLYFRPGSDAHVRQRIRELVGDVEAKAHADEKPQRKPKKRRRKSARSERGEVERTRRPLK